MRLPWSVLCCAALLGGCMSGGNSSPPPATSAGQAKDAPTASAASGDPALLTAHDWQLAGAAVEPRPWLRLTEGKVSGNTSCNGLNGTYSAAAGVSGGSLSFGPLAQSKRYCTETAAQERAFTEALRATTAFRGDIAQANLEFLDAAGQVLLTLEIRSPGAGEDE